MLKCGLENLLGDVRAIALLIGLYILQGIPLGLASAMPLIIQSGFKQGGVSLVKVFSFAIWPFSLKLLWAPIVDSVFVARFGRRKSWLIPTQYLLGGSLIVTATQIDRWFARAEGSSWGHLGVSGDIKINVITAVFFVVNFLAATQDVVVDGWALSMLSQRNRGFASTCNTVGQHLGYCLGFFFFIAIESPVIANKYLRKVPIPGQGLVSVRNYLLFWGVVLMVATTLVAFFKRETFTPDDEENTTVRLKATANDSGTVKNEHPEVNEYEVEMTKNNVPYVKEETKERKLTLMQTYMIILKIFHLRAIGLYIPVLFTFKIIDAINEKLAVVRLLDIGVSKELMTVIQGLSMPISLLLPLAITRWSNGPRPLAIISVLLIPKLILGLFQFLIIIFADYFRVEAVDSQIYSDANASVPIIPVNMSVSDTNLLKRACSGCTMAEVQPKTYELNTVYTVLLCFHAVVSQFVGLPMFVGIMAFHARVSDPKVGATYMTLLNTMVNVASAMSSTLMLYLVEPFTKRSCEGVDPFKAGLSAIHFPTHMHERVQRASLSIDGKQQIQDLGRSYLKLNATCWPLRGQQACQAASGQCTTYTDGYYVLFIATHAFVFVAYFAYLRKAFRYLDTIPKESYSYDRGRVWTCRRPCHDKQ